MAHLVIGPTNSGKSTFIESKGLSPVIFGFEIANSSVPEEGAVHYNLLYGMEMRNKGVTLTLEQEPVLDKILKSKKIDYITIIVCPISELIERARKRVEVEVIREDLGKYSSEFWIRAISESNLFSLYENLFDILELNGLKFDVVNSSEKVPGYPLTDRTLVHRTLRGDLLDVPKKEDIEAVMALPGCEYQKVLLPRGYHTAREYMHLHGSRESTFSQFSNVDFQGRSVLDIGSALGDMLFRAERRGASRLVGIEMMKKRFEASMAIGSLLGSRANFYNVDFLNVDFFDNFDDVLLLNVIHHVSDVRSFFHKAAKLTKKRLIVEFPTLNDIKFRRLGGFPEGLPDSVLSKLPVLGVSHKNEDQTFVMTLAAVERILSEVRAFGVERLKSPISGRELVAFHV